MSVQNKPDYKIFASGAKTGEVVSFPDVLRGWGVTLDTTGGIPPMEFFNSASMRLNEWLMYLTQRGVTEWDAVVEYPKSAMTMLGDTFYVSLKETKNENPSTSQSSWKKFSDFFGIDGKLSKDQNGADITDKNKFRENIGLNDIAGRLLNVVKFAASGTYTPSPGTKSIIVEAVGGGGASGNLGATGSNQNAVSAAGSNGAYAKARYTGGFSSVSVTIGAGGTVMGGGGGAGGDAGKTSFGSLLNCPGGKGSLAGQPGTPPFNEGAAQPSESPTGSGIIIAKNGMYSSWPTVVGLGMASNFANVTPSLLGEYGLGGDGIASGVSALAVNGKAGNPGVVIVWEYS